MNYTELQLAKSEFDSMCRLFNTLEKKGLIKSPVPTMKLQDVLRLDVAEYMMYLSASDGWIDPDDVEVYQAVTGFDDNEEDMLKTIKDNKIYSTAFESTVPESLKVAIEAEKVLRQATGEPSEVSLPELFVNMFERVGLCLIEGDGHI